MINKRLVRFLKWGPREKKYILLEKQKYEKHFFFLNIILIITSSSSAKFFWELVGLVIMSVFLAIGSFEFNVEVTLKAEK